jgi:hypothetical protein
MVFFTTCGDQHTVAIAQAPAGGDASVKSTSGLHHFAMGSWTRTIERPWVAES